MVFFGATANSRYQKSTQHCMLLGRHSQHAENSVVTLPCTHARTHTQFNPAARPLPSATPQQFTLPTFSLLRFMKLCIAFGLLLPEGQAGTAWHPSEQQFFPLATSPASYLSLFLLASKAYRRSDCLIFTSTCCQHRCTFRANLRS